MYENTTIFTYLRKYKREKRDKEKNGEEKRGVLGRQGTCRVREEVRIARKNEDVEGGVLSFRVNRGKGPKKNNTKKRGGDKRE